MPPTWPEAAWAVPGDLVLGEHRLLAVAVTALVREVRDDLDDPPARDEGLDLRAVPVGHLDDDEVVAGGGRHLLDGPPGQPGLVDLVPDHLDRRLPGGLGDALAELVGRQPSLAQRGRERLAVDVGEHLHRALARPGLHVRPRDPVELRGDGRLDRCLVVDRDVDPLGRHADQRRADTGASGELQAVLEVREALALRGLRRRRARTEQDHAGEDDQDHQRDQPPVLSEAHASSPRYQRSSAMLNM